MNWNRILSSVVALIYAVVIYNLYGSYESFSSIIFLILPLGLIWFPEDAGNYVGSFSGRPSVTETSPAFAVLFMGWILLTLPFVVLIVTGRLWT